MARRLQDGDDRCEINSLYVGEVCVASQFCVRTADDYTILKIGYDQEYAKLGPGQVLMDRTIERCCEDPDLRRLDLVTNASWCKDWQTSVMPMRQACVALKPVTGRLLVALHRLRFGSGRRLVRRARDESARVRRRLRERAEAEQSSPEAPAG